MTMASSAACAQRVPELARWKRAAHRVRCELSARFVLRQLRLMSIDLGLVRDDDLAKLLVRGHCARAVRPPYECLRCAPSDSARGERLRRKKLRQRGPNPVLIVVVARAPRAPLASASGYYGAPAVTLVRQRARPSVRCSAAPPARARAAPRRIRSHAGAQHRALCARARWLASRRAERAAVRARPSPRRRAQRRHPVLIMCASRTTSAYPQLQASSWPPSSYSPSRPTHLFHMLHMQDGSQLLAVCPCMWLTPW